MNVVTLKQENRRFENTTGVSQNNRGMGFIPAFLDKRTGDVELARLRNGAVAPMHLISWLPKDWASECDERGAIIELKNSIVSGFVRDGVFFTRKEAVEL